ncbi:DUF3073 domain-containing protein [Goodfellowiella coeruleoviolacea]|jgi:hypothetical protein|uniref:DUF3073 domain-containing protein n=1 Tax=Goodfellowiella coeruleoviolacea TaxID=334858 RepID=A0AAE3KGF0_9PSEU|nr:DUF3073 domain-containing protein [Goodfellowiella coeruleoviolacea]MCP2166115.1 Protein of unknown function (DUF3073) [Goodfellowiella coeruleoviolacea]
MGRGRAKAKQAKVARELKYRTPHTDWEALQRELSGAKSVVGRQDDDRHDDPYDDGYDDYHR